MSIPGLGREPVFQQPAAPISANRTLTLQPFWEWRFEVGFNSEIRVKLISGTAEKDGTELASQQAYRFSGIKSKISTLEGCQIEVDGIPADEFLAEVYQPTDSPMNSYLNLHFKLTAMRETAAASGTDGPRVMICGSQNTGKTTVVRTLASYATRVGSQPLVVNTDPREGMLSLPGTLSASVLASVLDIEAVDGWGTTPTSGPNQVPVKLPLVFCYGKSTPTEAPDQYRELVSRIAGTATSRFSQDSDVRSSGIMVDTPAVDEKNQAETDLLVHVAEEFSMNIVIVLGSPRLTAELSKRLSNQESSLGEKIHVIPLDKSDGVAVRDESFREQLCEALIKEYFFGTVGHTLSPATQQVDFDSLTIYRLGDFSIDGTGGTGDGGIVATEPSPLMSHWTLAIAYASTKDPPEMIRTANLMGFVYVADVDKERRKVKILAPVAGRLGDRPLLWGSWPEPFVNLLG